MAQRAGWLVIALLGVLLIAGLALLGRDIHRLGRTGPKWRRRLVGAGLALLSVLGLPTCGETKDSSSGSVKDKGQPDASAGQQDGKAVLDPADFRALERGAKADLRKALDAASKDIQGLAEKGPSPPVSTDRQGLPIGEPTNDAGELDQGFRLGPPEPPGSPIRRPDIVLCYAPLRLFYQELESLERISARLPLLEKLAEGKVRPDVARKALASIENDLKTLAGENVQKMPEGVRLRVEGIRKAAEALADKLKATLKK